MRGDALDFVLVTWADDSPSQSSSRSFLLFNLFHYHRSRNVTYRGVGRKTWLKSRNNSDRNPSTVCLIQWYIEQQIQWILNFRKMLSMERIPNQLGYLILTEDGAVLTSGGELENNERIANVVAGLITMTDKIDFKAFRPNEVFHKISITYSDHCYIICLSNKKIHVLKKRLEPTVDAQLMNRLNV